MADEITTSEAAELLGVSARHVLWYHVNGYLPGRRVGQFGKAKGTMLFNRADVVKLNANKPKKTGRPKTRTPAADPSSAKRTRKRKTK